MTNVRQRRMDFSNVKLILGREIRDQLRDRRTMFMIFVLPILLYPLLGMSFFQISQFMHEQPTSILVVGAEDLDSLGDVPPLLENHGFSETLFEDPGEARLLELHFAHARPPQAAKRTYEEARRAVQAGEYDAALYFPDDFAERLEAFLRASRKRPAEVGHGPQVPQPEMIYTTANEKSQIAYVRLVDVLRLWNEEVGQENLAASGVPASAAKPFDFRSENLADETPYRGAALWSKILPVLLLIWALTGAFYPAVDLCAGEKERGTLETLLSSPARRSEIVLGKLLTIMLFSMITAVLNVVSVGLTGWLILGHLPEFEPPPPLAAVWLSIALVPVAALFSALCLALAAFARSTKEGQYYLMPLLLVTMPLAVLPMAPGVELNLGNSLIPVSGVVLLLRSALEGNHWQALQFLPSVMAVTLAACLLAVRWAVDQFNSESVLFRESERLDVGLWLRHLLRDRQPTPTVAGALVCGLVILMVRFFMGFAMASPRDFSGFARLAVVTQLVVIATPALLMTVILTSSPRQTLLLRRPRWSALAAAVLLAIALHPTVNALQVVVTQLYPISDEVKVALEGFFKHPPDFWVLVLVVGVVPAICEELAFRGFVLSGFRHLGHKWRAIIYTAVLFGLTHAVVQQILIASLVGVVIGYVAVQSGSILACIIFHMCHNTLALTAAQVTPKMLDRWPVLGTLMAPGNEGICVYRWPTVTAGAVAGLLLLVWFGRLPYHRTSEEELQDALDRDAGGSDP